MKIGLIGHGKMGKLIEELAIKQGHEVVSIIQRETQEIDTRASVYIDFSTAQATAYYLPILAKLNLPHVIGTTGWDFEPFQALVVDNGGSVLYSPNFSLGMALFTRIIEHTCKIFSPFRDKYATAGIEMHHDQKKDSPSGTAKMLQERFSIPFTSLRCGSIPGTHEVLFDSKVDTIKLSHSARSREGFASGALLAAQWLINKKGWFTLDDMLDSIYGSYHTLS